MSPGPSTPSTKLVRQPAVVLTAHPLQRVGAFALAELGDVDTPGEIDTAAFDRAVQHMTDDLVRTASVEKSQDEGGFWLGASYLFWPNSAGMNTTNRGRLSPQERREQVRAWRTPPDPDDWPDAPCALCGRPACAFYGKVDVPLGASTSYRNTTPPGHDGLALCVACLGCFHALPYGCAIFGGRATAVHSWDDAFLARTVPLQVQRTRAAAMVGASRSKPGPYARERVALRLLRGYGRPLTAGVDLIVFSNSNREQVLDVHSMEQPLAEWLRATIHDSTRREGFRYLVRAHCTKDVPGSAMLARNAFRDPPQVLGRVVRYLGELAGETGAVPGEAGALVGLCFFYAIEVLHVNNQDVGQVRQLAARIADVLPQEKGALTSLVSAQRDKDSRRFAVWLRKQAVSRLLHAGGDAPGDREPFVTTTQWELLFGPDGTGRFYRDLLLIAVLEELHKRGWRVDDPEARAELEDELILDEESEQ